MSYECDNDNHDIGCQCPGVPTASDKLAERLERLAQRYETNNLPDHARGVRHALREVQSFFAPVELR